MRLASTPTWLRAGILALCMLLSVAPASAAWPDRPITMVVPYPPGGAADIIGRIVTRHLALQLPGSTWVVENKAGAGTVIGAAAVAQAAPDGYTLLFSGNTTYTLNPALKSNLPYEPLKSFESLGLLGGNPLVLIVHPSLEAKSVQELVALAKRDPGKLSYASFGVGTTSHFAGEMFKTMAGVDIVHVPYKGSAPAMQDLMAGQIKIAFDTSIASAPQIAAGKVRALALTSTYPLAKLPGVPTLSQAGVAGFDLTAWIGVVAPRGLPDEVRRKLVKAMADAMAQPALRDELQKAGMEPFYEPPSAYDARVEKELPAMRQLVHRARIVVD